MNFKTIAAVICAFFMLSSPILAEDAKPQVSDAQKQATISIHIDPRIEAGEKAYSEAVKPLTDEQKKTLKSFEIAYIRALDWDMQVIHAALEMRHCREKDAAFAKDIEKYRSEIGVLTNLLQARSRALRTAIQQKGAEAMPFIDSKLVNAHYGFTASFAVETYGQMAKISFDRGGFVKTDCAALAQKLDAAFKASSAQGATPEPSADKIDEIRDRAENGDNEAMVVLGLSEIAGQAVPKDVKAGLALLTRAAEAGYPRGQYMLGLVLGTDMAGEAKDKAKAKEWLQKAAAQGDKKSVALLKNFDKMQEPESTDVLRKKAENGDADAAYELGGRYAVGMGGVEKDSAEALKWKLIAAGKGVPYAESDVGMLFLQQNKIAEGIDWMTRAAQHGVINSQYELALIYSEGKVVPRDATQAKFWAKKAADSGDSRAIKMLEQKAP